MGNFTSCLYQSTNAAMLVDYTGGHIRQIKLPITAAEIMLDHPGHLISSADQIRRTSRIPATKAEEELSAGKLYLLVPANRIHSKASPLEIALIDSVRKQRRPKQRSSKISPALTGDSGSDVEAPAPVTLLQGSGTGLTGHRTVSPRPWMPVLEPILEDKL